MGSEIADWDHPVMTKDLPCVATAVGKHPSFPGWAPASGLHAVSLDLCHAEPTPDSAVPSTSLVVLPPFSAEAVTRAPARIEPHRMSYHQFA